MERRELFKIIGAGLVAGGNAWAQHEHGTNGMPMPDLSSYAPRFFSHEEYRSLGTLCDILIPADETSPSASQAGVLFYIDTTLWHAPPAQQHMWKTGIAGAHAAAQAKFGKPLGECSPREQEQIVAVMAENEGSPKTDLQGFFDPLKQLTLTAYCYSDAGMRQYLGYRGDTAIREFAGCNHPEHQPGTGENHQATSGS